MNTRQKWIAIGVMLVVWVAPAAAVTDAQKCEAAKLKVAGKYGFARLKADAKAVKSGAPADYSKSDLQFGEKWMDAEIDGGGMCPTIGDAAGVQNEVAAFAEVLAAELGVVRFVDNGDGTVTDTRTRLVWEKKDELAGIHDTDNLYQWSTGSGPPRPRFVPPNGAAFVTFLGTLNNSKSDDGTSISGCFAGYCDWRLPTKAELESILVAPCGAPPCIDPAFGPTAQSLGYWSATGYDDPFSLTAWFVDFANGSVSRTDKVLPKSVRAVRGGS